MKISKILIVRMRPVTKKMRMKISKISMTTTIERLLMKMRLENLVQMWLSGMLRRKRTTRTKSTTTPTKTSKRRPVLPMMVRGDFKSTQAGSQRLYLEAPTTNA